MRTRIAVAALAAVLLAGVVPQTKSRLTTALGRFFRDVARARARTRRYGNKYALAQMVLKAEAPPDLSKPQHDGTVTQTELEDGDGVDGAPAERGEGVVAGCGRLQAFAGVARDRRERRRAQEHEGYGSHASEDYNSLHALPQTAM